MEENLNFNKNIMSDIENSEQFVSKDIGTEKQLGPIKAIPANPYTNIKRELSEEELKSPAVQKLLLNDHDKFEQRIAELEGYVERFHTSDKYRAILEEKLKTSTGFEVLYSFCLTAGSALAGISGIFWENKGYLLLIIGFIFILGGIISKIVMN
ncbi:MAG: hypothetical protein AB7V36_09695 [Bacteroidales bacterium]